MPETTIPTSSLTTSSSSPAPILPTLRSILRQATSADHERLDARLSELDLHSIDGYRRFLEINAAALLPLEMALVAGDVEQLLPDWKNRARTRAILEDLNTMDGHPHLLESPLLDDQLSMLGTLYVLEGSRLGAAHLLKMVSRASDPFISSAVSFLGHGAGMNFWASFLEVLENHVDMQAGQVHGQERLVESARGAFALFFKAAGLS